MLVGKWKLDNQMKTLARSEVDAEEVGNRGINTEVAILRSRPPLFAFVQEYLTIKVVCPTFSHQSGEDCNNG